MFYIVCEDGYLNHYILDDDLFKVIDTHDLIAEVLSGKELKNAITQLGYDKFPQVCIEDDNGSKLYTILNEYLIFDGNAGLGVQINKLQNRVSVVNKSSSRKFEDNFEIKLLDSNKVYDFMTTDAGLLVNGSAILKYDNPKQKRVDFVVRLRSLYCITRNIMRISLAFAGNRRTYGLIYIFFDLSTGRIFHISSSWLGLEEVKYLDYLISMEHTIYVKLIYMFDDNDNKLFSKLISKHLMFFGNDKTQELFFR